MRRVLGILLNAATALSLLFCVLAAVWWIRSQYVTESITLASRNCTLISEPAYLHEEGIISHCLVSTRGQIGYTREEYYHGEDVSGGVGFDVLVALAGGGMDVRPVFNQLGFDVSTAKRGLDDNARVPWRVMLPYWFLVAVFALLPLRRTWTMWKRQPQRPGACVNCGYDLRATPERCPECGRVTEKLLMISN